MKYTREHLVPGFRFKLYEGDIWEIRSIEGNTVFSFYKDFPDTDPIDVVLNKLNKGQWIEVDSQPKIEHYESYF
jgi:hypothetical protein